MSKKLLALLLAMIMVIGSFTSVFAEGEAKATETKPAATEAKPEEKKDEAKPEEVKTEEKKEEKVEKKEDAALTRAIEVLKKAGYISGFSKETEDFKAEQNVTRAQFASMIVRVMGSEKSAEYLKSAPTGFTDVPAGHWANGYIAVAKNAGYVNGYPDNTFKPEGQITYAEMATMLTIALGKNEAGDRFPQSYIMKAQQLGLFKDVEGVNYSDMATRGDVFKMVYNMITNKEFGNRKILKAIVLENARVENLGEREVTVEVIDVVQKANWADASRDKKGDQHKYVLDKDLKLDAEDLLGKVVDITVDQNDKIVEVKADDTYKVIEGAVTEVTRNKIGIDGTNYNVGFDERYDETDERIFRTYLNDKNYAYRDFAQKYAADKAYDFARVTLKNGKVIFIDAYQFDDIAPVTQVKDGAVYYRDDTRKANEFKAAHLEQVRFHDAKGFSVAEVKDIVKDDVIHFYSSYEKAIVRKDAKVVTELVKTHRDVKGREFAVGKDAEYRLLYADYLRAIYSVEGKYFNVVFGREDLEPIIKDNVTILRGLNNSVQLIESAKAWKDGVNAVKKVHSRGEVELLPPTGEKFWATETRDSKYEDYLVYGSTNNQKLFDFDFDDIVYYAGNDKNEIEKMGVLLKKHYTVTKARFEQNPNANQAGQPKYIVKKDEVKVGYADNFKITTLSARYITSGVMSYRYFNNLKAYYLDKDGELQQVGDWDRFYEYNKDNKDLESYVVSELELKNALTKNNVKSYYFLSNANDIASIVIFDKAKDTKYEQKYAVVKDFYRSTNEIGVVDAMGNEYIVDLDKKLPADINERDIVLLNLEKASLAKKEKTVVGHVAKKVIDRNKETVKFESLRPTNTYLVTYNDGRTQEVYFDKDTNEFNRQSTDYAQIYFAKDKNGKDTDFIAVIRYMDGKIGGSENDADIRDLGMRTNHLELELDGRFVPVTNRILFKGARSDYGQKGYFESSIDNYKGGKVKVYTDRYGEIICVEGYKLPSELQVADKVEILNSVKRAIEKLGTVYVPSAKTSQEANYFQAKVDALVNAMNKELKTAMKISASIKATVAYSANKFTTTVVYDAPAANSLEAKANAAVANPNEVKAMNDAKVLTKAEEAKAVETAIKELAPRYTIEAIYPVAGTYNVNDDDVLAFVKEKLAIAATNSSLAHRYADIQDFDAAKLKLITPNGVVAEPTVDATTKAGAYKVTFEYNGETLEAVVFTLGVKTAH